MKPFDLPPSNPADWLCADPRRPAEVREHGPYWKKPPDEHPHHPHPHLDEPRQPVVPPPPPFPPELTVPSVRQQMDDGVWLHHHARERQRRFYAAVSPNPDDAAGPVYYRPTA